MDLRSGSRDFCQFLRAFLFSLINSLISTEKWELDYTFLLIVRVLSLIASRSCLVNNLPFSTSNVLRGTLKVILSSKKVEYLFYSVNLLFKEGMTSLYIIESLRVRITGE